MTSPVITASVREIQHTVRIGLVDAPAVTTPTGSRRKPKGLRITYGIRQDVQRVDVTVEYTKDAELWPGIYPLPAWLRELIERHRPADVNDPDADRRTGMGGHAL